LFSLSATLQGGLYAPSIFIGAALGSAYGTVAHAVCDPLGLALSAPQAYALVGEPTLHLLSL
jgi:H+/Cl- antiporter ClcA